METHPPPLVRDPAYRRRRFQNWMIVGLLYAFFYMTRYNFNANAPTLMDVFGWTKVDLAILDTAMPFLYGLSVLLNAAIADRVGGRRAFLIGAAGVVVANVVFGAFHWVVLEPPVFTGEGTARTLVTPAVLAGGLTPRQLAYIMSVVWAVNAYFQSFGALSIVKINAQWFHLSERGTFGAIFGVLIRLGLIFAFSGTPILAEGLGWYWAWWLPALLVAVFFVLTLLFVKERPEDAGFATLDTGDAQIGAPEERVSVLDVAKKVFTSRVMWTIALASVMLGFVRRSVIDSWWPVYFKEILGVSSTEAVFQTTAWGIALMGIAGGFVLGPLSDRVFQSRRAPVVVIGFVGMALCLVLFRVLGNGAWQAVLALCLLSFFINGAHGVIGGAASMDFGGKRGAATAAGLFDGMQYLVAAPFTGLLVGWITETWGWQVWKLWPLPFALVGTVLMATLWNEKPRGRAPAH
ncbi:MAG: MFS transporter [Deltaproteobacteria bacterium]|nr:MFS transporter [Deltaproteobacteria bacterium]